MIEPKPVPNIASLVAACHALSIPYTFYDTNENLVGIHLSHEYFFANFSTPFNSEALGKISKDKEFTYRVVRDHIAMPRSIGYIDPRCDPKYRSYITFATHEEILVDMEKHFMYPFMVKMNSGLQGMHVFKCSTRENAQKALQTIFNKKSQYYDYVALAQEYIPISREFRVLVFRDTIVLAYEKDSSESPADESHLSPLHRKNAKAVLITNADLLQKFSTFMQPLCKKISLGFVGLDVVVDGKGKLWLLEINTRPGFEYFVRDNGSVSLIEMYKKILTSLQQ